MTDTAIKMRELLAFEKLRRDLSIQRSRMKNKPTEYTLKTIRPQKSAINC